MLSRKAWSQKEKKRNSEKSIRLSVNSALCTKKTRDTANLEIFDIRYHDFNGIPAVNWY